MRDIVLEPLNFQDEKAILFLYETRKHPEICKYLFGKPPQDIESHKNWLRSNIPSKRLMFILKCDDNCIGYCHAYNFDDVENTLEAGFVVHPDFQGKGFGHILIEKFFEEISKIMPNRRVQLYVQTSNERAIGIYQEYEFKMMSWSENVVIMERGNDCVIENKKGSLCL
jgi:RimJ/RimL family protein N-acetyltransferase